jgi:hypothetical protein
MKFPAIATEINIRKRTVEKVTLIRVEEKRIVVKGRIESPINASRSR